ncbi:LAMI_0B05248g1_1 [Lachancea mirantina]|uniref:Cytochrome c oxidase assembly protein COX20, mitochondrial n=1 Tax=Lachancea mirantina TaxID=1230905 RepID=A0A1G4IW86_9SACH|nr:LAMI_0B05248g1_1 [Lachancea mirantina]
MVWPFSSGKNQPEPIKLNSTHEPAHESSEQDRQSQNYTGGRRFLLEDTTPRFSDSSQSQAARKREEASLQQAWNTVSWQDFSLERLTAIPCFRDAGMSGFASMFVAGSVMFLYHKNPARAANWAVGAFMLGSIVGWEQCRLKRKRSFHVAQMARDAVAAKERPMLHEPVNDKRVLKEWEGHTTATTPSSSVASSPKPWYKFW